MSRHKLIDRLREAASHTLIYGLGSIAQRLLGFVLIPLYTTYYSSETYGALTLLTLAGTMAGTIFYFGASSALSRSFFDYDDAGQRRVVVSTSFYITITGAVLQVATGILAGPLLSRVLFSTTDYSMHVALALAGSAFTFLNGLFFVVLRFERKSVQVVVLNLLSLVMTTALVTTLLVKMQLGLMAPLLGTLASEAVVLVALATMNRRMVGAAISRSELALQLKFGIPQIGVGLAYYALDSVDRLMIGKYASLSDVGIYSLGYKMGMVIHILFILPFSQIWAPMRMQYRKDPVAKDLSRLILTYYFVIGGIATVGVSMFARQLVGLFVGRSEYLESFQVIPLIMFGHLCYGAVNIVDAGIYFERKAIYHVCIFTGTVLFNLALNYLLVPRFGYMAAAWSKAASFLLLIVAVHLVARRFHPLIVERCRLVIIATSSIAVLTAGSIFNPLSLALAIAVKVALLTGLVAGWATFLLTDRERKGLRSLIAKRDRVSS